MWALVGQQLRISLAEPSLLSTYTQGDILFSSRFVVLIRRWQTGWPRCTYWNPRLSAPLDEEPAARVMRADIPGHVPVMLGVRRVPGGGGKGAWTGRWV